jgi:hypothetical protein
MGLEPDDSSAHPAIRSLEDARWSVDRANTWWDTQPLPVGCNFIPSTAINQLEMWQEATFDLATVERELGWAAGLGFNAVRVYLHDLVWEQDSSGFLQRIDEVLAAATGAGIRVILVLFDDVWNPEPRLGPQPDPFPGRHNSGWVQGPGLAALNAYRDQPEIPARLEAYVRGITRRFADDPRVLMWDVYNEPGGYPSPGADPVGEACLPLLADVFAWVRAVEPDQPLTCGLWWNPLNPLPESIGELQLAGSDIVSFHHYGPLEDLIELHDRIRTFTNRPLLCSEYLARNMKSRFETHLPAFSERSVGAINWGLVSGRSQTIYPWWSWFDEEPSPEPEIWFHDILRPDGSPFDPDETRFLRTFLKTTPRDR